MEARGFIFPSRIIGILFLLPALFAGSLAVYFYTSTNRFLSNAISVQGVVVDLKPSASRDGTTYATEFEFDDEAATKHRAVTSWSSNPPAHSVGNQVEVLYLPGDPSSARLRSFTGLWLGALICAVLTVVPLVFSAIFLWLVPLTIRRVWPLPVPSKSPPPLSPSV